MVPGVVASDADRVRGWETSPEKMFGVGGISLPGKQFRGFITNDCRVVHAMIAHLEEVRAREAKRADGEGTVRRVLAVTSLYDSPEYAVVRSCAAGLAEADGGEVVLFEITAASFLVSPYSEENRRQWIRTLGEPERRRLGRSPVAKQMEVIRARGAGAQAILPTSHGFRHLAEWAEREDADLILIPVSLVNPGLFERLRGYSLRTLLDTRRGRCWWFIPTGQPGGPTLSIHRRNRNEWPPRWQHRAAVAPNLGRRAAYRRLPATPSPSPRGGSFRVGPIRFPCSVPVSGTSKPPLNQ